MSDESAELFIGDGPIKVNTSERAAVMGNGANVVALAVDLESKRAEVGMMGDSLGVGGFPAVFLEASEHTLGTRESELSMTEVAFTDYPGWKVWCAEVSRYTLAVCLIKSYGDDP